MLLHSTLSTDVELTCSDCVTALTTTRFEASCWVTRCYMQGLSLTVPLKPDKTLSEEILNSWPTCEGFVQFKDSISQRKNLMLPGGTVDNTGERKEAERRKEKKMHSDKCMNAEGDELLGGGRKRCVLAFKNQRSNYAYFTVIKSPARN